MELRFNGFVIDAAGQRLLRQGREVTLGRRAFDLLHYLAERQGALVTKEELLSTVWKAQVLSEGTLSNTVAKLRRALGQRAKEKYPIETIHGRGYRFKSDARRLKEPAAVKADATSSRKSAFVGRAATIKLLLERLACAGNGAENLVVLLGEAGIGKTRVAQELSSRARAGARRVWEGAAYEGGGAPPYWPWLQILRAARDQLSEEDFQSCVRTAGSALVQLLPELDLAAAPSSSEPQAARFLLFEAVSQFLKSASALAPLLLVLEDLHCADLGSIELLEYASHTLQQAPILFLATLRTGEALTGVGPEALSRLGRTATFVNLSGLSEEEVARLAQVMTSQAVIEPEIARALHVRTRGNPLFVCQILDLAAQRGEYSLSLEASSQGELPPAIKYVLRRKFAGLPPATHRLLQAASVIGTVFDLPILSEVAQTGCEAALDRLEPALRLGVVERCAGEPGQFGFAHALARETFYEELGIRERGELHGAVAQALRRREPPGRGLRLAEIAQHALRVVPFDLASAVEACRRAASAARDASSFDDAARFLARAIERMESEASDLAQRFPLLLELGENHYYAGRIASAWNAFRDAVECARRCGRLDLLADAAPHLVDCLELGVGDLRFANDAVEQALGEAREQPAAVRAGLLAQRAELATHLSNEERRVLLDQAAELAQQSGAPRAILEVAHSRALLRDPTCAAESVAAVEDLLNKLRQHPEAAANLRYSSLRRFGAHMTTYLCNLTLCDLPAAALALESCERIADATHIRTTRLAVDLMHAGRALAQGRLDELRRLLPPLDPRVSREIPSQSRALAAYGAALLEAEGKLDLTRARLLAPGPPSSDLAPTRHGAWVAMGRANIFHAVGELERARLELRAVPPAELARMPVRYGDLGALCSVAELCCALRDRAAVASLYDQLSPYEELNAVGPRFEYYGAVAHYLGLLARALGLEEDARRHFEQALRINRALDMPHQLARTQRELQSCVQSPRSSAR
jgi:DNA-binding winged helix-turn-helix (wHTH) protein/tetratricopeptide (TPR) repeat protein